MLQKKANEDFYPRPDRMYRCWLLEMECEFGFWGPNTLLIEFLQDADRAVLDETFIDTRHEARGLRLVYGTEPEDSAIVDCQLFRPDVNCFKRYPVTASLRPGQSISEGSLSLSR